MKSMFKIHRFVFPFLVAILFLSGCIFEVSVMPFGADIVHAKLIKKDSLASFYNIEYRGWSDVESLTVYVDFESCKGNAFIENGKPIGACYPDYAAQKHVLFPAGSFTGSQVVKWLANQGDSASAQLYMSYKDGKTTVL